MEIDEPTPTTVDNDGDISVTNEPHNNNNTELKPSTEMSNHTNCVNKEEKEEDKDKNAMIGLFSKAYVQLMKWRAERDGMLNSKFIFLRG